MKHCLFWVIIFYIYSFISFCLFVFGWMNELDSGGLFQHSEVASVFSSECLNWTVLFVTLDYIQILSFSLSPIYLKKANQKNRAMPRVSCRSLTPILKQDEVRREKSRQDGSVSMKWNAKKHAQQISMLKKDAEKGRMGMQGRQAGSLDQKLDSGNIHGNEEGELFFFSFFPTDWFNC